MEWSRRAVLLASAGLMTAAAGCGGQQQRSQGASSAKGGMPDTVTVGHYTLANPYGLAIQRGWFKEEFGSTEVKFVELEGTANALAGLASGDLDIALIGTPGAATAFSQQLPVKVAWIYEVIESAEALVLRDGVRFEKPKDLTGHSIATPFGSTAHYALLSYMKLKGLSEKDVSVVDLTSGDLTAAFRRGEVDGAWINEPQVTKLVGFGGKVAITTGDLFDDGVIVADVAAVGDDFTEKYPEALKAYIRVMDRSTQAYLADPAAAHGPMAKYLGLSKKEAKSSMQGYRFLTAKQQRGADWLGGGLATSISDNAAIWERLGRVPKAAGKKTIRENVVTGFLSSWKK